MHNYLCIISDIDECAASPCQNQGTCTDQVNDYTCECVAGFIGDDCETGEYPINMPLCASTGPVLCQCCQHRTSTGPVLAHNGMFIG